MGEACQPELVKPICAVTAGREEWLEAAGEALERELGPTDLSSRTSPFNFTDYYEKEMGPGLLKRIHSFRELIAPENLVEVKHATNRLELSLAGRLKGAPARAVNLDPGYIALSKMVLATTKDYAHRVHLRGGIYAEVTLRWRNGQFQPLEWTYPDYRTEGCREFFSRVRAIYVEQRRREEDG